MIAVPTATSPRTCTPVFSGHETFALRSAWLKKAYDLLQYVPDLFLRDDAFVQLGVGKNMAQSIRYWGRVCGIFDRAPGGERFDVTPLGHAMFNDDDGWDPFLVTPASRWLLHWQVAARQEAAFTWYFTFNHLRVGEFTIDDLAGQLAEVARKRGWKVPTAATLQRDVDCMVRCYAPPGDRDLEIALEDALSCPLHALGLIQRLPERRYALASSPQPDLPDALVAYAILMQIRASSRQIMNFSELAYAPSSPGRVFRLNEDGLLSRLLRLHDLTGGSAYYTDQAGIRQVAWMNADDPDIANSLLQQAFTDKDRS